jgi:tetratricopeptide (TPR) repeat protein
MMTPEELIILGKRYLEWLKEHKITVGLTAVLVVGLSLATMSYLNKKTQKYETVWKNLGELSLDTSIAEFQEPKAREELLSRAVEAYKGMLEGSSAKGAEPWVLFQLGNAQYSSRKYDEAITTYKEFLNKYSDHSLKPFVRQSLAYACEEKGHYDAALMYFQGNAPTDSHYLVSQEKWDTGRCYEKLGQKEEAKKAYTGAINLAPESPWAKLAQYRLDSLE